MKILQFAFLTILILAFASAVPQIRGLAAIEPQGHPVSPQLRVIAQFVLFFPLLYLFFFPPFGKISESLINIFLAIGIVVYARLPSPFFDYIWDVFLIESIYVFLLSLVFFRAGFHQRYFLWPLRLLFFKLMFCMGIVKFIHGMPEWQSGLALKFFWQNQPMPGFGAWYAAQIPDAIQKGMVAFVFFAEAISPFLIFAGKTARKIVFSANLFLQVGIYISGNFGFFNILTVIVSLSLWDFPPSTADNSKRDRTLEKNGFHKYGGIWHRIGATVCLTLLSGWIITSAWYIHQTLFPYDKYLHETSWIFLENSGQNQIPAPLRSLLKIYAAAKVSNPYALFGMIPKYRLEIGIQGSVDGIDWQKYRFKIRPDNVKTPPIGYAPHHWRLDHQMYYESFRIRDVELHEKHSFFLGVRWIPGLIREILNGNSDVTSLFALNPFPNKPPQLIRFTYDYYEFTRNTEMQQTGNYWKTIVARPGKFNEGVFDKNNLAEIP